MKRNKRIAALFLALMLLLAAGCAAPVSTPAQTDAAATAEPTPEPTEEPGYEETLDEKMTAAEQEYMAAAQKEWKAALDASELTTKTVDFYVLSPDDKQEMEVAFLDAHGDVPFIELEQFAIDILYSFWNGYLDSGYDVEVENAEGVVTLTRESGTAAIFDFNDNFIYFDDLSGFNQMSFMSASIDELMDSGLDDEGQPAYFKRTGNVFDRTGAPIIIDMDKRFLPMVYRDGKGYLPMQTLSDLLLCTRNLNLAYNGEAVFLTSGAGFGALSDLYYSVEPGPRSEEMAEFNFNQLCLALDMFYGLADVHNIDGFEDMFLASGLYEDLLSTDPVVYTQALNKLAFGYLADGHSGLMAQSHYVGQDTKISAFTQGNYSLDLYDAALRNKPRYAAARAEAYPDGVPGYEEIGNTAYITMDEFSVGSALGRDFYTEPATADDMDTMGLVIYAHSQITRENSPIENVVLDLSNNGGGAVNAAIYLVAWFLGDCNLSIVDTVNGGQSSVQYMADVNMDREFDETDSISDKNLYCIISPSSFSCGNLVPAMLKSSGRVTLIGHTSGGGGCMVMQGSTADGTLFSYSSNRQMSTVSNGAYMDMDGGVVPNVELTKIESFYDREALTEYINDLP